jgi:hypothetical protein
MAMKKIPQVRYEKISQKHTLVSEAVSVLMCRAERRVPKEAAGEKATVGARMRAATASFMFNVLVWCIVSIRFTFYVFLFFSRTDTYVLGDCLFVMTSASQIF